MCISTKTDILLKSLKIFQEKSANKTTIKIKKNKLIVMKYLLIKCMMLGVCFKKYRRSGVWRGEQGTCLG